MRSPACLGAGVFLEAGPSLANTAICLAGIHSLTTTALWPGPENCGRRSEVSPVMWDAREDDTVVGGTSAADSISLRLLGERMETGWEHRTLCRERGKLNHLCFCSRSFLGVAQFPGCT